ncbi:MAG: hypothetical protein MI757_17910, partial [Pirellulales bacterium]|nr:hypothetical protein [Pirellulales bacterium]
MPYARHPRFSLFFAALAVVALFANVPSAAAESAAANKASESRLFDSVKYLASDELEGRGLETKGIHTAADYIADEFRKAGLKVDVYDGKPFQQFDLKIGAKLGPKEKNTLVLTGANEEGVKDRQIKLKLGEDFQTLTAGGSAKFDSLPLVFVGYGITDKDQGYDDYAGIDVKGKAVVMLRHEPQQNNPHSGFA